MKRLHALAGLALFAAACAPVSNLTSAGYVNPTIPYAVHYADPTSAREFIAGEWTVISHSNAGVPRDEQAVFHFDVNGDGKEDATRELPRYDLRLLHADGSRVSVRRFVFGRPQATELHAWIRELARSISGTIWFDDGARRWTSRLTEERDLVVAGQRAVQARVEIADADRLALSPGAIDRRLLVVVVETPFEVTVDSGTSEQRYPVRLLATYDAPAEGFDVHLPEFDKFLGAIDLDGSRGVLRRAAPPAATPPATPASH